MTVQKDPFIEWVNKVEEREGWSDKKFADAAIVSHSSLVNARKGKPPGWDVCKKLADAAGDDPCLVFRLAGLLPTIPAQEAQTNELIYISSGMGSDNRELLIEMGRNMRKRAKGRANEQEKEREFDH